jgi:large conductance mechanosensitive channel
MVILVGFVAEFNEFLKKYQVIGLAVAFIMGAASTKLVTALVNDIIMPIISVALKAAGASDWKTYELLVGPFKFLIGDFIAALIDFLIIALVIFIIVKLMIKEEKK